MAKIELGDIFEIKTPLGKAYLHYFHKDESMGELVRILPGLYQGNNTDLSKIIGLKEEYVVFFPLKFANRKKVVSKVGHHPWTKYVRPKFMRTERYVRGQFLGWDIVDTTSWKRTLVKKLSLEEKKLSPWGIWNDTLLIERLTEGWTLAEW